MNVPIDRLVLVVHGIGDPTPGGTMRTLARSLAAESDQELVPTQEVLWLPEGSDRDIEVFPCHLQRIRNGSSETVLAEVFWGDLSRVAPGALGALKGFFNVVFGLRHAARHASNPERENGLRDGAAGMFQRFSALIAYLLRGPVAAMNFLLAVVMLLTAAVLSLSGVTTIGEPLAGVLVVGTGLLALIGGRFLYRRQRGRAGEVFFLWTAIGGLLSMFLPIGPYWLDGQVPFLTDYYDGRVADFLKGKKEIDIEFYGVLMLDFVNLAWIATAMATLVTLFFWALSRWRASEHYRPGVDATQVVNAATAGLWFLAIPTFWVVVYERLPESARIQSAEEFLSQGLQLMGFHWVGMLLFLPVAFFTGLKLFRWARRTTAKTYDFSEPAPRLLLGKWIERALIFASFVGSSTILLLTWATTARGDEPSTLKTWVDGLQKFFDQGNVIAFQAAVFLSAVLLALLPYLRLGLDILLDVINHFLWEPADAIPGGPRLGPEERESQRPLTPYVRRERIQERLREILVFLVAKEEPAELTILAHSQGTVVAADVLAEGLPTEVTRRVSTCQLVTMGSPFGHIYQHYFSNDYPPLNDPHWDRLRMTVGRWINIFRIDDWVGTDIEPGSDWPENHPVDRGGHTNYWSDRQVLEVLIGPKVRLLG